MTRRPVDRLLLLFALLLMALGMVFIYSASAVKAFQIKPAGVVFLSRQLLCEGMGLALSVGSCDGDSIQVCNAVVALNGIQAL